MRILIFNWKDIKHPLAGGAEIVTHQYAKHLVKLGHQLILFTSYYPNLKKEEFLDGVKIIRKGNFLTVYLHAFWEYQKSFKNWADIVIDQIHGIPFFTPLYVKQPMLAYIHELAGPIWQVEFSFLATLIGPLIEKLYLTLYRFVPFLTDSFSTKQELSKNGVKKINVIDLTIEPPLKIKINKSVNPTLVYVGRLGAVKRLELLIQTACLLIKKIPNLTVIIAGKGKQSYVHYLFQQITKLKLKHHIKLLSPVSEVEKYRILANGWLLVHPSLKEGFGLNVLEAASQKTPTLCFKVSGLQDVIINERNGFLINPPTAEALAQTIFNLITNKNRLNELYNSTFNWFCQLPTWEHQSNKLNKLLKQIYSRA